MCERLKGKVALITGGGSGMGRAMAVLFAAEGAAVGVFDRASDAARSCVEAVKAAGGRAIALTGDVTRAEDGRSAVEACEQALGGLDILVNSAGVIGRGTVETTDESEWDRVVNINLKGTYLMSKSAIPALRKRGGGSIVNVSSGAGLMATYDQAAYDASKAGVINLTRSMALDFARDRIRVNCLVPGPTVTPMSSNFVVETDDAGTDEARRLRQLPVEMRIPLGRLAQPEEQARAALFLASDESSFMTGSPLLSEGGRLLL